MSSSALMLIISGCNYFFFHYKELMAETERQMFLYKALGTPLLENWVQMLVTKEEFRLEQVLRGATGMFRAMESLSYKKESLVC